MALEPHRANTKAATMKIAPTTSTRRRGLKLRVTKSAVSSAASCFTSCDFMVARSNQALWRCTVLAPCGSPNSYVFHGANDNGPSPGRGAKAVKNLPSKRSRTLPRRKAQRVLFAKLKRDPDRETIRTRTLNPSPYVLPT